MAMTTTNDRRPAADIDTPRHEGPAPRRRWLPWLTLLAWLLVGGGLISQAANLPEVVESGASAYLPQDSASKQVTELSEAYGDEAALPAVVVWTREGGLTADDQAQIAQAAQTVTAGVGEQLTTMGAVGPIPSEDGTSAQLVLPIAGTDTAVAADVVETIRSEVGDQGSLVTRVTGPAAVQADMQTALGAIDVLLVAVTCSVILVILLAVYRSLLLPFMVIAVGVLALGAAHGAIYLLADAGLIRIGAEVQGIVSVLVLGCATDYAMLLVHRYSQELRRGEERQRALSEAVRRSWEPIVASAATVIVGLLCLVLSSLGLNRQLGPAAAIGVLIAMVAMLTLMPALLRLVGPAVFWPRRLTRQPGEVRAGRVGRLLLARPRTVWVVTSLVLIACASGVLNLRTGTLTDGDMVIGEAVESRLGAEQLHEHFPSSLGSPAIILVPAENADAARAVAGSVDGVADVSTWTGGAPGGEPVEVQGRVRLDATLQDDPDSTQATQTVRELRDALAQTSEPGRDTLVGGQSAVRVDFNDAAEQDRRILLLILGVVLVIMALLLRAVVAAVVVVASVVLSFFAAMGVSTWVFQDLLGFPGVDATFPIHAFVFLVALGVDYSIFLMSRVRECVLTSGPRLGVVQGLRETGAVITSAGIVLAATFAALALVPIVLMVQLAFIVAFGLMLDTMIVRTLLVPALAVDLGRPMWWPSRGVPAEQPARTAGTDPVEATA